MREAKYEKAFELLDELKEIGKKKRMVICELEDAIYECYEASKDDKDEEHEAPELEEESSDIDFRGRRGMRRGMRHHDYEYDYDREHDYGMRKGMRMRNRYGRYSY